MMHNSPSKMALKTEFLIIDTLLMFLLNIIIVLPLEKAKKIRIENY
ncbi:MAG: hypothetical protein HJHJAOHD_02094 [Flavobacteriales bacterium]|nr:hypothetical protein [Flavobacteriales bacterium]